MGVWKCAAGGEVATGYVLIVMRYVRFIAAGVEKGELRMAHPLFPKVSPSTCSSRREEALTSSNPPPRIVKTPAQLLLSCGGRQEK